MIKGFIIQGGDFEKGNGSGGCSIYGEKFDDEHFLTKHSKKGILSMANCGKNTNGSQFFICFQETSHLDGKHVAFGKVDKNIELLAKLEEIETGENDLPSKTIEVVDCGELK